jgi:hypothetical protein
MQFLKVAPVMSKQSCALGTTKLTSAPPRPGFSALSDKVTGKKQSVTEVLVNSDGIFLVYQTPASTEKPRPRPGQEIKNSGVPKSSSKRSRLTNAPDASLHSRSKPHILPKNDDVWPSFEGLQIDDPQDNFD